MGNVSSSRLAATNLATWPPGLVLILGMYDDVGVSGFLKKETSPSGVEGDAGGEAGGLWAQNGPKLRPWWRSYSRCSSSLRVLIDLRASSLLRALASSAASSPSFCCRSCRRCRVSSATASSVGDWADDVKRFLMRRRDRTNTLPAREGAGSMPKSAAHPTSSGVDAPPLAIIAV